MNRNRKDRKHVCPTWGAVGLDNLCRKWVHNPQKILKPFIKEGMTVLDIGCGPGFFSLEMAKMLHGTGKVIAADVQEGMLEKVRGKISGTNLAQTIELHQCDFEKTGIVEKVDFAFAFWMVHEVKNQEKFLEELASILKPDGLIYIIEPKLHVSKTEFGNMVDKIKESGLKIIASPKVFFSRTIVLSK